MRLSVDNINRTSPYWVLQLDDMLFRFTTKNGLHYRVGFYPDTALGLPDTYHFFIDNVLNQHSTADPDILKVITAIIEEFFRQEPFVMLYVCDPTDNRQAARNRLYAQWYNEYEKKTEYAMYSESVLFEGTQYYAGLLMKKNNPFATEVITVFHSVIQGIPEQMAGRKQQEN